MPVVDSCVWIGAKRKKDQWHEMAVPIIKTIHEGKIKNVFVNDHIFNECVTFLINKKDFIAASELGKTLIHEPKVRLVLIDSPMFLHAWKFSKRYKLSFTDGTILTMMKILNDKTLYSFDAGFDRVKWVDRKEDA